MRVKEAVDRIIAASRAPTLPETCDQLMAGDWDAEVTGIATTFMATVDVIRQTIASGANLIITHEPTYFTGRDTTEWLQQDEVYLRKKKLIEDHKINIWRFHDHMHMTDPDLIYAGLHQELGWEAYLNPQQKHCYIIPETTVEALANFLKEKLQVKVAQIVGEKDAPVKNVGILVGGGSLGLGSEEMPMQLMREQSLDVLVCGEIVEWTACAYVRDAAQLGMNKSLIILGHNRTEEVGMKTLPGWLSAVLPEIPARFIEAGEPFSYQ